MPNTYTNLVYHVVFSTKFRKPAIDPEIQRELYAYIGGIVRDEGGTLLEIGGMPDHVHLLIKLKPSVALSDLLRRIKGNSSKWLNETRDFHWQEGFSAFTVSESVVEQVRHYIRNQEEHHRKLNYQDELRALLTKHGVAFDERYLWD